MAILYPPLPLPGEEHRLRWEPFPWLSTFPSLYQAKGVVDLTSADQGVVTSSSHLGSRGREEEKRKKRKSKKIGCGQVWSVNFV